MCDDNNHLYVHPSFTRFCGRIFCTLT